jgi:hypothetical protein
MFRNGSYCHDCGLPVLKMIADIDQHIWPPKLPYVAFDAPRPSYIEMRVREKVMGVNLFRVITMAAAVTVLATGTLSGRVLAQTSTSTDSGQSGQPSAQQGGGRGRGMGFGGFPGGGRGILGTVIEATADHYTIKADNGDVYIVHFSANTRMMKQAPGQNRERNRGQNGGQGQVQGQGQNASQGSGANEPGGGGRRRNGGSEDGGDRPMPQTIKPTDIHVGDIITAGGELDAAKKSIGAVFIALVDPESAKQMREMQANYGKTWLAGRITAIHETTITIDGAVDHAPHDVLVDENTSFRQRRDSITLADIHAGEQLRAEGAVKGGIFTATTVTAMQPREGGSGTGPGTGLGPANPGPQ